MKLNLAAWSSPTGQLVGLGLLALFVVAAIAWQRSHRTVAALPAATAAKAPSLPRIFQRVGARFDPPAPSVPPASPASAPSVNRPPSLPRPLPLSVVSATTAPSEEPGPGVPFGRMIPCETVVTLESSRLDTPVIGLVTADVWAEGRVVIPAGAEVHARASLDRSRERIAVEGSWLVVWRGGPGRRPRELRITGVALNREDAGSTAFAPQDGSAGLRGEVLRSDRQREVKLFATTFLASATTALQDTQVTAGLLGQTALPAATARNATLAGTSAVLREYAQQVRESIARDGFYVRVPAGTPFYLYVTQSIAVPPAPPPAAPGTTPSRSP